MANKIVLISDDSDFFDYILSKLELRKSDELFRFTFDVIPEKIHLIDSSVLIVNSENAQEKTLDLLGLFNTTPIVVFAYNDDDTYRRKCYRAGAFDFMTILTPDAEFRARMIPALSIATLLAKNKFYRNILVSNKILDDGNEVFLDYEQILQNELDKIGNSKKNAIFVAISPSDKNKLLLHQSVIEAAILNNIRRDDILMSFAANKYFLLMYDVDIESAKKIWQKICLQVPEKIFAGFCKITNQKKQQLINEVLNKLHESINQECNISNVINNPIKGLNSSQNTLSPYSNFKMFKQEFGKKIEQIITPVFYQIQQKYSKKLTGVALEHGSGEGYGNFYIKGKYSLGSFRITSPGFSKINIDITYQKNNDNIDAKRITLEPEELEAGLLEDLLEQFIVEYKKGCENES